MDGVQTALNTEHYEQVNFFSYKLFCSIFINIKCLSESIANPVVLLLHIYIPANCPDLIGNVLSFDF